MQCVAASRVAFDISKYTSSVRTNALKNSGRRVPDASKHQLLSKCSEFGNRCSAIRPRSATYLYSIRDDAGASSLIDDDKYFCGIIELTPAPMPDATWKTTLEHVRNMDLSGKYVSVTNISTTAHGVPNDSWIEVVTAFHQSGAKSIQYKT